MKANRAKSSYPARLVPLLLLAGLAFAHAADPASLIHPDNRIAPDAPDWAELAAAFAQKSDVTAGFTEHRFFPFKKNPVELKGEVRVSARHGLSLHYTEPEERTVIMDGDGLLIRQASGQKSQQADPRAGAVNEVLLHILRLDLPALARDFELYGHRDGDGWMLALAPRTEALRRAAGRIEVKGEAATVCRIEIRRSARQYIEILVAPPRSTAPFSDDELHHFFR